MPLQEYEGTNGLGVLDDLPPLEDEMQPEAAVAAQGNHQSEQMEPAESAPVAESTQAWLHVLQHDTFLHYCKVPRRKAAFSI